MSKEQTNTSAKLNGKKIGIIGAVLLILIALIVGISIYNFSANRLSRQLDLGNRYLEEQNYEQAIVEFDKAIAIDPMSVEAYLGKAEAYEGLGDIDMAIQTLQEGYDRTGRESLQARIEELQAKQEVETKQEVEAEQKIIEEEQQISGLIEFPFSALDITVMGYDLSENHFAEIRALFPTGEGYWVTNASEPVFQEPGTDDSLGYYYINNRTYANGGETEELWVRPSFGGVYAYWVSYQDTNHTRGYAYIQMSDYDDDRTADSAYFNVPVGPGASYEDWCAVMQIDRIKEYNIRAEERDGWVGIWDDNYHFGTSPVDGGEYWVFSTGELKGFYSEVNYGNGYKNCTLRFVRPTTGFSLDWSVSSITAEIRDEVI